MDPLLLILLCASVTVEYPPEIQSPEGEGEPLALLTVDGWVQYTAPYWTARNLSIVRRRLRLAFRKYVDVGARGGGGGAGGVQKQESCQMQPASDANAVKAIFGAGGGDDDGTESGNSDSDDEIILGGDAAPTGVGAASAGANTRNDAGAALLSMIGGGAGAGGGAGGGAGLEGSEVAQDVNQLEAIFGSGAAQTTAAPSIPTVENQWQPVLDQTSGTNHQTHPPTHPKNPLKTPTPPTPLTRITPAIMHTH